MAGLGLENYCTACKYRISTILNDMSEAIDLHRSEMQITCAEDCWCWGAEADINKIMVILKKVVDS